MKIQKTVLFADDEQSHLDPIKFKIEALGYKVISAISVAEALQKLKSNIVDLIILDVMMDPGEGLRDKIDSSNAGFASIDMVKKISPRTQIIYYSVKEDTKMVNEIRKKGALFFGKGETSYRKIVSIIQSKLTGLIKDSDLRRPDKYQIR